MKIILKKIKIKGEKSYLKLLKRVFSLLYKREEDIILFGSSNGSYYSDNSKVLFEWIINNRPQLRPVWLTNSEKVYKDLKGKKFPVAKIQSYKGRSILFKSNVAFYTHSLQDITETHDFIPSKLNLIALRHGKSVKKVRYARENHQITKKEKIRRDKESQQIRFAISTSEFISEIQEQCLLIGREKHVVTGYPRNDELLSPGKDIKTAWNLYKGEKDYEKVILYAPSWRHGREATKFFPFDDFDQNKLKQILEEKNILLLLRPHGNDLIKYNELRDFLLELTQLSGNIRMGTHDIFPDVNSVLPFIDILISDYSSLYHDFLLLDRPMIFIPYDFSDFKKQNGFLYDYYENIPGPAVGTFDEFCQHVKLLIEGDDTYREKRRLLTDKVHKYKDDNSSERVAELIKKVNTI